VNGRTQEHVNAAIAQIQTHLNSATISGIAADFSFPEVAETIISKLPALDVLVNNVGVFEPKPFADIPDADWYRLFEINVRTLTYIARKQPS
jgi:NAD(P)-dependent dehydrogenase (short-subunit alcohol dehydrogenase family)